MNKAAETQISSIHYNLSYFVITNMNDLFDYKNFSTYRAPLMGIAILGVLMVHSAEWAKSVINLRPLVFPFWRLVFTEGFLFLSGFGLYYSFTKDGNIKSFYHKRILRLLLPFMIIVLPFYLFDYIVGMYGIRLEFYNTKLFLLAESGLYFFFYGNINSSMWYISMTLLLYALFPWIYRFIFSKNAKKRSVLLIAISIFLCFVLYSFAPDYYFKIKIGIEKIPVFIAGIFVGFQAMNNRKMKNRDIFLLILATYFCDSCVIWLNAAYPYAEMMLRICCMISIAALFNYTSTSTITTRIVDFFGWFGTYSLELYLLHLLFYNLFINLVFTILQIESTPATLGLIAVLNLVISISLCKPVHNGINLLLKGKDSKKCG